jgi:hypothetical protein
MPRTIEDKYAADLLEARKAVGQAMRGPINPEKLERARQRELRAEAAFQKCRDGRAYPPA